MAADQEHGLQRRVEGQHTVILKENYSFGRSSARDGGVRSVINGRWLMRQIQLKRIKGTQHSPNGI
jgi:hypothetical protein